jgi:hypothetical protein
MYLNLCKRRYPLMTDRLVDPQTKTSINVPPTFVPPTFVPPTFVPPTFVPPTFVPPIFVAPIFVAPKTTSKEVQTNMRQYFGRLIAPCDMDHSKSAKDMKRFVFNRVCDDKTNDVCCICLQSFMARTTMHAPCGHVFHHTCWCRLGDQRRRCPICMYQFHEIGH